jgi:SAM-dependent methyltransferase
VLTPRRRRGHEYLDEPGIDGAVVVRSLRDVARSNTLFGGRRAVLRAVDDALPALASHGDVATLVDVGTGLGDIPLHARRLAARRGVRLTTGGVELSEPLARASRDRVGHAVLADGFALPFADASIDVVTCSQVLHHFAEPDAERLVRELSRVARARVIVGDLRRSWLAAGGFWLASWALRFHPVTRHDGVVSVLRGFTRDELDALARRAGVDAPHVRRRLGWRVVASWTPTAAPAAHGPTPSADALRAAAPLTVCPPRPIRRPRPRRSATLPIPRLRVRVGRTSSGRCRRAAR